MIQRQRIFPGVFLLLLCACGGTSTQPTVAQNGIEPSSMKYNKVFSANEQGFAKVNVGEGSDYAEGIIDGKGNEVIAPRTDMLVNDITGAQALVQRGREFLFVDLDLGLVDADALSTEKGYQYAEPFRCGRAMVQVDDRWFYIDSLGRFDSCALP